MSKQALVFGIALLYYQSTLRSTILMTYLHDMRYCTGWPVPKLISWRRCRVGVKRRAWIGVPDRHGTLCALGPAKEHQETVVFGEA